MYSQVSFGKQHFIMPIIIPGLATSVNIWLYQALSYLESEKSIAVTGGKAHEPPPAHFGVGLQPSSAGGAAAPQGSPRHPKLHC